ncbi:hypothetical protein E3N88_36197 [Mikania micrantha]|uniref:Uncharacterized protein n=1 Tax=Mikania micrantha TaxID=192012 RepID=A0A5N6M373_9ASTR|nr:hypothetical protein E3N88_36197 [Mikania micrantha]
MSSHFSTLTLSALSLSLWSLNLKTLAAAPLVASIGYELARHPSPVYQPRQSPAAALIRSELAPSPAAAPTDLFFAFVAAAAGGRRSHGRKRDGRKRDAGNWDQFEMGFGFGGLQLSAVGTFGHFRVTKARAE